jgi:hypothetical protein
MMRSHFSMFSVFSAAFILLLPACASTGGEDPADGEGVPAGKSVPLGAARAPSAAAANEALAGEEAVGEAQQGLTEAGIQYHDGQVMTGTVGIYYIWYGNWNGTAKQVLKDLASNIGGSGWWNIETTYTNGAGTKLSNSASFLGGYQYTGASYSKSLSDSDVKTIVANTINQNKLPKKTSAIYVVLTSKDVNQVSSASSAFCSDYCGWHTSASIGGSSIKYAWVGDASQLCPDTCGGQSVTPNGQPGADGMANHIAHELTEAATDPDGGGWYDGNDDENADKCSWTFGTTLKLPSGAKYNVTLGPRKFLIQRNWVNAGGGYCAQSYSSTDQCPNDAQKKEPGLCGCGKPEPHDVVGFKDAQGYPCSEWQNYDCTQAAEAYGYTAAQEATILAKCSASCGVCPSN